ncbi:MAG: efflux RND transporter periplasmic adaptor subunit [Bacteroidetes bacterium]|nr:efflux RND transporter periplasmic adaptor subunit [Bacteroidota bacterium]MBS1740031.1 efflux RND transporter periplasmic adaptor subunit [Bacteroidota bacterium]MBS1777525.1 efflux RND transporter periplasmic adaptor subunit [Bacteroidota bacterium]
MNYTFSIPTIVALALLLSACGADKKKLQPDAPAVTVTLGGTKADNTSTTITASGKIEAENSANLSTRMMGFVTKVHVKVGQKVDAGQLLVSVNNSDLQAKKAQVEASILQAKAAYTSAKKDYDRFVVLFSQQSASQKELDDMTTRYEMAKAALEGARQMRNEVQAQFKYSNISAPFAGTVTNTFIKEGDMANPGMPLISLEGTSHFQVSAMVPESEITHIKNDMPVKVLVKSSNEELEGKVTEVSTSAKNTGGQYLVKINLKNQDNKVLSGMFVNVQFPIAKEKNTVVNDEEHVMVPESCLVHQGQLTGIYTVSANNTAILRWVRLGKSSGDHVMVLSGLNANEPYILSADGKLFNGVKVNIK